MGVGPGMAMKAGGATRWLVLGARWVSLWIRIRGKFGYGMERRHTSLLGEGDGAMGFDATGFEEGI